jgi:site-specific recombinase
MVFMARTHSAKCKYVALRRAVIGHRRRRSAVSRVQRRRRAAEYWINNHISLLVAAFWLALLTALRSATPLSKSNNFRL